MKFWNNLLEKISNMTHWIIKASAELLEPLKSIDEKLSEKLSYLANEEPIKNISSTPVVLLSDNDKRQKIIIQNIGLEPCYIKLENGVSKESFHFVLAPDTFPSFGNGGSVTLDHWHGPVYAIAEKETKVSVLEY